MENNVVLDDCLNCPGVDVLEQDDVEVLLKYFKFVNIWVYSALASSSTCLEQFPEQTGDNSNQLFDFLHQVRSTLGSSLVRLNLNIFEYAAFKSFCIWNLKFFGTSTAMKIVAEEHHIGITWALRKYYKVVF